MNAAGRRLPRIGSFLRDRWFSIDLRTLGLFRIVFGLRLIVGLAQDAWDGNLVTFFSNDGVLTNHFSLFAPIQPRPWSLLLAFSTPGEVAVAFAAILTVYVLYTVGWKTKLMQVLVVVCFISIVNRNLLLQDGGCFVTTVLAVWTVFLPLGARFSLDRRSRLRRAGQPALRGDPAAGDPHLADTHRARDQPPDRHVSFVCFALLLQIAVIYLFNAANKSGPSWHSGTAVHYVLWQNRMNTSLAAFVRLHEPGWFSPLVTGATLIFEWTAPVLILAPVLQTWSRRALIAGMCLFHLGIASMLSLGAFSYVMMVSGLLFLGRRDWEVLESVAARWWRRARRLPRADHPPDSGDDQTSRLAVGVVTPMPTPMSMSMSIWSPYQARSDRRRAARWKKAGRVLREAIAMFLFVAMFAELTLANACVPPRFQMQGRPEWMAAVLHYLRIYQSWGMFSADAPGEDGIVIVDALLADGTHVDPLTNRPPDFDAFAHGPWHLGHHWSEYMSYYPWERHRAYRDGLLHYVLGRHARAAPAPEKGIRTVEIVWLSAQSPPPGTLAPQNVKRETLVSYVVP